jgi:hypothetical protein
LIGVVVIASAMIVGRRSIARLTFGTLAYLNDPRTSGKRWRRENAALQRGIEWFFGLAGCAFGVYALLDWLGVITLAT